MPFSFYNQIFYRKLKHGTSEAGGLGSIVPFMRVIDPDACQHSESTFTVPLYRFHAVSYSTTGFAVQGAGGNISVNIY